jgi:hypothetical protein
VRVKETIKQLNAEGLAMPEETDPSLKKACTFPRLPPDVRVLLS